MREDIPSSPHASYVAPPADTLSFQKMLLHEKLQDSHSTERRKYTWFTLAQIAATRAPVRNTARSCRRNGPGAGRVGRSHLPELPTSLEVLDTRRTESLD